MGQQELADLCELSVDQISNIERGKNWTGEISLALIADTFQVSLKELLDYSENEAFIDSGGLKWRASRKVPMDTVRSRAVTIVIQRAKH